jgi:acyl-CoA synthetase (AMP-forming)/AMP-acid ligase II
MPELLTGQLRLMAEHFPGEVGLVDVDRDESLAFADWDSRSSALARGLRSAGVETGERVALHLPLSAPIDWVVAYAAVHKAGAVAVPLNTRWVTAELGEILRHSEVAALITGPETWPVLEPAAGEVVSLRVVVWRGDAAWTAAVPGVTLHRWAALVEHDPGPFQVAVDDDAMADIVYTSGTTGRPKGVVVRHANASLLANGVPCWSGAGWLHSSPLFTFAGITAIYNPMKLGMRALYLARFDTGAWLDAVAKHRPAMVFLVPAMAELLLADPRLGDADLTSIGLCAVGGSALAPGTQRRLQALMPQASVSNGYGMTEAGPAFAVISKEEAEERVGSVGRAMAPTEFLIVDEGGRPLPAGEVGELVIKVPGRPREYYRDPEATARTWQGDRLHTGDLARLDADGYLYIVGRAKDVIIRGGNNVHAGDVEAVLYEHPAVAQAAVAGVAHSVLGEDVAAWLVPAPGATIDLADVEDFCRARLADYKVPRRFQVVDDLPRNATGKVVKQRLTGAAGAGPRAG